MKEITRPQAVVALTVVLAVGGVGLSACGNGPPPAVASIGSTTTVVRAPSAAAGNGGNVTAKYTAALGYATCMRSHGAANFPDPSADGTLNVKFATGGKDGSPGTSGIDRMSPQFISASNTCRHLLPGAVPTPAEAQRQMAQGLKFARCMRTHGVPAYPDPNTSGVVHLSGGIDPNSSQFLSSQTACRALSPGRDTK